MGLDAMRAAREAASAAKGLTDFINQQIQQSDSSTRQVGQEHAQRIDEYTVKAMEHKIQAAEAFIEADAIKDRESLQKWALGFQSLKVTWKTVSVAWNQRDESKLKAHAINAEGKIAELQPKIDAMKAEVEALEKQIQVRSGQIAKLSEGLEGLTQGTKAYTDKESEIKDAQGKLQGEQKKLKTKKKRRKKKTKRKKKKIKRRKRGQTT